MGVSFGATSCGIASSCFRGVAMGEGRPSRVCRPWGMGYGVWGIDRSGPLTPYPIPHASHTRSREGSQKSQTEKILQCMPSERNSGSRNGRVVTKSGVLGLGYGVWGMIDTGPTPRQGDRSRVVDLPTGEGLDADRLGTTAGTPHQSSIQGGAFVAS